jgi:hypothetical protein
VLWFVLVLLIVSRFTDTITISMRLASEIFLSNRQKRLITSAYQLND